MSIVEITATEVAAHGTPLVRACAIDRPAEGESADVYHVTIEGWVVGREAPVEAVELVCAGNVLRRVAVDVPRPDVGDVFPMLPWAARSGFRSWLSVVGLPPGHPVALDAVFADGARSRFAAVRGSHRPVATTCEPSLWPVMVSTIGRAGSTWLMRLLAHHPEVVVHPTYPYELRHARYWWHTLQVLTDPADPSDSALPDDFQTRRGWTGHNPYRPEPFAATPAAAAWSGRTHVEETADFCLRTVDEGYRRIAADLGKPNARCFAEKGRADHLPWLAWELYPEAREIFLVRDFRDVVSSMLAFNRRAGRIAFGPAGATSDAEVLRFIREVPVAMLERSWPARRDRALLVRYEDLIARPAEELSRVLAHLGLDNRAATVGDALARASRDDAETRAHLTSRDAAASLGRWRTTLPPDVQALANDLFRDPLAQFGYDG